MRTELLDTHKSDAQGHVAGGPWARLIPQPAPKKVTLASSMTAAIAMNKANRQAGDGGAGRAGGAVAIVQGGQGGQVASSEGKGGTKGPSVHGKGNHQLFDTSQGAPKQPKAVATKGSKKAAASHAARKPVVQSGPKAGLPPRTKQGSTTHGSTAVKSAQQKLHADTEEREEVHVEEMRADSPTAEEHVAAENEMPPHALPPPGAQPSAVGETSVMSGGAAQINSTLLVFREILECARIYSPRTRVGWRAGGRMGVHVRAL